MRSADTKPNTPIVWSESRHELESKAAMTEFGLAAVLAYDNSDRLIYCNRAALKLCGAENIGELQPSPYPMVISVRDGSQSPIAKLLSRIGLTDEVLLEVKPAKIIPCLVSASHLLNEHGECIIRYANILDVTEMHATRARLEARNRELVVATKQAELADRAKTEFLANMSHELRTPLNAIIGFSEVILGNALGPNATQKYHDYVRNINESGNHLLALITDILDLSKIESGVDELHEEPIDVKRLVHAVSRLVMERAEAGEVSIELEFPSDLPPLYADARKLKQMLINLLSNGIKFTLPGGTVTLKAWSSTAGGYILQVSDTGIGIAFKDIPKALNPFQQVSGDLNRKYEGTGLGLPLTKSLIEQHNGAFDLQSEVGVGTTVTLRFPVERIQRSTENDAAGDTARLEAG